MSRHCQHSSRARTCACFACFLLACSKCHELFDYEASQSNYIACLGAASNKADFLHSHVLMLKRYHPTATIYQPESQDNCGSDGLLFTATRAPPHACRQASLLDSIWSFPGENWRCMKCESLHKVMSSGDFLRGFIIMFGMHTVRVSLPKRWLPKFPPFQIMHSKRVEKKVAVIRGYYYALHRLVRQTRHHQDAGILHQYVQ
jgi:hypothetical protein